VAGIGKKKLEIKVLPGGSAKACGIQVAFPARNGLVHLLRSFLHGCLEDAGFPLKFADDVELAFDEAVENIIEHTYKKDPTRIIWLGLHLDKNKVRLDLKDDGPVFLPHSVPPVDIKLYFAKKNKGGLGLHIMKKSMDSVEYSHGPRRGNVVSMIKSI
jgi:serine/threonine-protein kinase RsbW